MKLDGTANRMASEVLKLGPETVTTDEFNVASNLRSNDGYDIEDVSLGDNITVSNVEGAGQYRYGSAKFGSAYFGYNVADLGSRLAPIRYIEYTRERLMIHRGKLKTMPTQTLNKSREDVDKIYTADNPTIPT